MPSTNHICKKVQFNQLNLTRLETWTWHDSARGVGYCMIHPKSSYSSIHVIEAICNKAKRIYPLKEQTQKINEKERHNSEDSSNNVTESWVQLALPK